MKENITDLKKKLTILSNGNRFRIRYAFDVHHEYRICSRALIVNDNNFYDVFFSSPLFDDLCRMKMPEALIVAYPLSTDRIKLSIGGESNSRRRIKCSLLHFQQSINKLN